MIGHIALSIITPLMVTVMNECLLLLLSLCGVVSLGGVEASHYPSVLLLDAGTRLRVREHEELVVADRVQHALAHRVR
jgi:hypothetical protein